MEGHGKKVTIGKARREVSGETDSANFLILDMKCSELC